MYILKPYANTGLSLFSLPNQTHWNNHALIRCVLISLSANHPCFSSRISSCPMKWSLQGAGKRTWFIVRFIKSFICPFLPLLASIKARDSAVWIHLMSQGLPEPPYKHGKIRVADARAIIAVRNTVMYFTLANICIFAEGFAPRFPRVSASSVDRRRVSGLWNNFSEPG